jgi:hypothetical protein
MGTIIIRMGLMVTEGRRRGLPGKRVGDVNGTKKTLIVSTIIERIMCPEEDSSRIGKVGAFVEILEERNEMRGKKSGG